MRQPRPSRSPNSSAAERAADRTLINCFHYEAFPAARRILPGIDVVPDVTEEMSTDPIATVELARALGAPDHDASGRHARIDGFGTPRAGVAVWVWGVTDEESIARSVSQGVDGILGKDVAAVVKVLDRLCPRVDPAPDYREHGRRSHGALSMRTRLR